MKSWKNPFEEVGTKDSFKMWLALPLPSIQMEMCSGSQADGGKFTAMDKIWKRKGQKTDGQKLGGNLKKSTNKDINGPISCF